MAVWHYHEGYEIYYQASGNRYMYLSDKKYLLDKGTLVFLTPHVLHYGQSEELEYYERYTVNFTKDFLKKIIGAEADTLFSTIDTCIIHLDEYQNSLVSGLLNKMYYNGNKMNALDEKIFGCGLVTLLSIIYDANAKSNISSSKLPDELIQIINYIDSNYSIPLTLDEIASQAHMNKYYLSHLFKKYTGTSVMKYLTKIRLRQAYNLLTNDSINIEQIAQITGFGNYISLERAFKKEYGCVPIKLKQ